MPHLPRRNMMTPWLAIMALVMCGGCAERETFFADTDPIFATAQTGLPPGATADAEIQVRDQQSTYYALVTEYGCLLQRMETIEKDGTVSEHAVRGMLILDHEQQITWETGISPGTQVHVRFGYVERKWIPPVFDHQGMVHDGFYSPYVVRGPANPHD